MLPEPLTIAGMRTVVYAKDQPEYLPLPAAVDSEGRVITKWGLTWWERLQVLWRGSIYLQLLTFNKPLQPIRLTVEPPVS